MVTAPAAAAAAASVAVAAGLVDLAGLGLEAQTAAPEWPDTARRSL